MAQGFFAVNCIVPSPQAILFENMVQQRKRGLVIAAAAGVAAVYQLKPAFVPPARTSPSVAVPAALLAAGASAPAWADPIGDAAKKLADGAYPFMKEVNWNSYAYLLKPGGSGDAGAWAKAVDKAIVMGSQMDSKLLKDGVMAHHKAIGATSESNPVLSKADFEAICAAIGRMIASVPESSTMDVYNAFSGLVGSDVPAFLMSTVNEGDAKRAYEALMQFKDVVKANPITSTPLPGVSPNAALKAIDKALVMGASMDGKLLKEAAEAHHRALTGMDSKLVATQGDYTAVNAALGKLIASVPQSQVMDVYNAFGKILNPAVPNYLYKAFGNADAQAAYLALLGFKDVVKAAQR